MTLLRFCALGGSFETRNTYGSSVTAPTDPIAGGLTVHELCVVIGSCTSAFTIISVLTLM